MKLKSSLSDEESIRQGEKGRHALANVEALGQGKQSQFHSKPNENPLENVKFGSGMI